MNKKDNEYIPKAINEVLYPTFATTKQYLEVHNIVFDNWKPKVVRINYDFYDDLVSVYFPIEWEQFFLEIHLTKEPKIEIHWVWIESWHKIYMLAISEKVNFEELSSFLNIKELEWWKNKRWYNILTYEPIKDLAYWLDEKLDLLLTELEKDKNGIKKLSKKADIIISVCRYQYISWNMWINFDLKIINRLNNLNLGIDIDTYIGWNKIL